MAEKEETSSDTLKIRQVSGHLLDFLRTSIAEYISNGKNLSAEIHQRASQPAQLVFYHGGKSGMYILFY